MCKCSANAFRPCPTRAHREGNESLRDSKIISTVQGERNKTTKKESRRKVYGDRLSCNWSVRSSSCLRRMRVFMDCTRVASRSYTGPTWVASRSCTGRTRVVHGSCMGRTRIVHESCTGHARVVREIVRMSEGVLFQGSRESTV